MEKSLCAKRHLLHFSWTRKGAKHHPALPAHVTGGSRDLGSELYQRLDCLGPDIVEYHGVTNLQDISGNRTAYGAQTNEPYYFHCCKHRTVHPKLMKDERCVFSGVVRTK